ncbi:MAG: ACT domain-containing protein [Desulfocapsaceae bacterium]|nr:ACT domain-containing protein [Desulfocapsaceae bacterium]
MKSVFITTITGPDSPGIIKSLAETTRGIGGEWETSKVMKLGGQFAALMKVLIAEESSSALKEELEKQFPQLVFKHAEVVSAEVQATKTINLEIDCKDRPGLTKDINNILANLDLVVENMEFNRVHVSSIGETMFNARLALAVAESVNDEAVAEEIESLSDDVRVSVI